MPPLVGWYIPEIILRNDDLPAPLCPIRAMRSPCFILQVIPLSAVTLVDPLLVSIFPPVEPRLIFCFKFESLICLIPISRDALLTSMIVFGFFNLRIRLNVAMNRFAFGVLPDPAFIG